MRHLSAGTAFLTLAMLLAFPTDGKAYSYLQGIHASATGQIFAVDAGSGVVFEVDPISGASTVVSGADVGSGPNFLSPEGVAVEASGDLLVADWWAGTIVRIDPATGDRTVVTGPAHGSGPQFSRPYGVAVEASGDLVAVTQYTEIFRIDPVTGARTIVSDETTGGGTPFTAGHSIRGIVVEASGDLIVYQSGGRVFRVDPTTGDRVLLSGGGAGSGPELVVATGLAIEASGDLLLTDRGLGAVLRIDPVTGDRTTVSGPGVGTGPGLVPGSYPYGVAVEPSGDLITVEHASPFHRLLRVSTATGDRTLLDFGCPPTPQPGCISGFDRAQLTVIEKLPGREKLIANLKKGPAIAQADFGTPTSVGSTAVALCAYTELDELAATIRVDRAGAECDERPCWKSLGGTPPGGKGYLYKDRDARSYGVGKLKLKGGSAGKSAIQVKAANKAPFETFLPTGIAAALTTATSVKLQLRVDTGTCFEAILDDISKQESQFFRAK